MRRRLAIFYLSAFLFNYVRVSAAKKQFSRKSLSKTSRTLEAGDIFTPTEMLPIASKLLEKIDEPGIGKGFVSSTKDAEELADKLFEAYFLTNKRIVTLKDDDISGIDALQALALSGEEANDEIQETATEPGKPKFLRGQFVEISKPRKSQYKLVTKTFARTLNRAERRGIPEAKKLSKKRNLLVNKRRSDEKKRRENNNNDNRNAKQENINKNSKKKNQRIVQHRNGGPINANSNATNKTRNCRWKYVCRNVGDLDSCKLQTDCSQKNSNTPIDDIAVKHKSDEHTASIKQFRKMLGISLIDEEVEKILESRNLHLNPRSKDALNRVESLSEYFNNIIVVEHLRPTTSLVPKMVTYKGETDVDTEDSES